MGANPYSWVHNQVKTLKLKEWNVYVLLVFFQLLLAMYLLIVQNTFLLFLTSKSGIMKLSLIYVIYILSQRWIFIMDMAQVSIHAWKLSMSTVLGISILKSPEVVSFSTAEGGWVTAFLASTGDEYYYYLFSFLSSPLLPYLLLWFFLPLVKGVHPVQWCGGGACVATSTGNCRGQCALAPPTPAAVLPVATQTSEYHLRLTPCQPAKVKWLQTDCYANALLATRCSRTEKKMDWKIKNTGQTGFDFLKEPWFQSF